MEQFELIWIFNLKSHPVTDVFIELQSKELQYYSMTLHITAHFSGLRYIMFHWPILSATIGKMDFVCSDIQIIRVQIRKVASKQKLDLI